MTWVVWRQHRSQFLFGAAAIGLVAAFLLLTGLQMRATFHDIGLDSCLARNPSACGNLKSAFGSQTSGYQFALPLFLLLPGLVGLFWGAPMVAREVEQGTHRLAWTQSVTPTRWMAVKLTLLSLAAVAGMAVLVLILTWWADPIVSTYDIRFTPGFFDLLGAVPAAYTFFALALGIAAGTLIQRSIPAMAATLVAFGAVRAAVMLLLRPQYLAPISSSYAFGGKPPSDQLGGWVTSGNTLDAAGHIVGHGAGSIELALVSPDCPNLATLAAQGVPPAPETMQACIRQAGIHVVEAYQPAARYWEFQWIEAGVFIALAIALLLLSIWWVQRRVS